MFTFASSIIVFASVLPTWTLVLIAAAAMLIVGTLGYVVFRWGMKNKAVASATLSGASAVFSVLQSMFKDKPDELDAHDFMKAFSALSGAGLDALKAKEGGAEFDTLKASMKVRIRTIVDSFPQLKDQVSDDLITQAADAFFTVVGYIPKAEEAPKV